MLGFVCWDLCVLYVTGFRVILGVWFGVTVIKSRHFVLGFAFCVGICVLCWDLCVLSGLLCWDLCVVLGFLCWDFRVCQISCWDFVLGFVCWDFRVLYVTRFRVI